MAGKSDIIDHISGGDLTKKQASEVFDAIFDTITNSLSGGDRVSIAGFGSFSISERAERTGRNPRTGEPIHIPASKGVRFKPGKELKEAVNG